MAKEKKPVHYEQKKFSSIWIPVVVVGAMVLSITLFFIKITVIDYNAFRDNIIKEFGDNKKYFEDVRECLFNKDVKDSYKDADHITYLLDCLNNNHSNNKVKIGYLVKAFDYESHKGTVLLTSKEIFAYEKIRKLYHYGIDDIYLANNGQMYFGRTSESYVYTINGEEPCADPLRTKRTSTIKLDDHWYYLTWEMGR